MNFNKRSIFLLAASSLLLAGCDLPFLADQEAKLEAKRQAEGMAVGSGCRYSGRALEECYGMNPKMSKAAIFNGWREMDGYMRENNIQVVAPEIPEPAVKPAPAEEPKPKAAEAPASEEKPKAAEAPKEVPVKPGVRMRKQPRRVA